MMQMSCECRWVVAGAQPWGQTNFSRSRTSNKKASARTSQQGQLIFSKYSKEAYLKLYAVADPNGSRWVSGCFHSCFVDNSLLVPALGPFLGLPHLGVLAGLSLHQVSSHLSKAGASPRPLPCVQLRGPQCETVIFKRYVLLQAFAVCHS